VSPTVFIIDDDPGVLTSLARLLRVKGLLVEAYDSAEAFLARRDPQAPGCLLLDVNLPGLDGLELQRRLAETGGALPVVFLTGHGDIPTTVRAMKGGASDFLTKPVAPETLLAAVRAAIEADTFARQKGADLVQLEQRFSSLKPREREVFEALAVGKLNKQIAADLGLVEQTVKFHRARLMERMQVKTTAELMLVAARLGIGRETSTPRTAPTFGETPPKPGQQ
jgi:FixJ family two-component response regulator